MTGSRVQLPPAPFSLRRSSSAVEHVAGFIDPCRRDSFERPQPFLFEIEFGPNARWDYIICEMTVRLDTFSSAQT